MVDVIYVEKSVKEHPRSQKILKKFSKAVVVDIEKYGEVFNPSNQNFRIQKQNPALILAEKIGKKVHDAPEEYQIGGEVNRYFSHMLNCIYDCRYCFLQGMYRSANYLLFVNYEDFVDDIVDDAKNNPDSNPWYFSGYDCDSLAFEPITQFAEHFLNEFARPELAHATLELRTKSTQMRSLEHRKSMPNVVIAYSLNPQVVIDRFESMTPSLEKRLQALKRLQEVGWRIGLRFDPVIWHDEFESNYSAFFKQVFTTLNPHQIDSVTLGGIRLPKTFHKRMAKLMPDEILLASAMQAYKGEANEMVAYTPVIEAQILRFCQAEIARYTEQEIFDYPVSKELSSGCSS